METNNNSISVSVINPTSSLSAEEVVMVVDEHNNIVGKAKRKEVRA